VIGTTADLALLVKKHDVGLVIFASSGLRSEDYTQLMSTCVDLNVRMLLISDMLRALQFWLTNSGKSEDKFKFMVDKG